jgi:hypothetical protein
LLSVAARIVDVVVHRIFDCLVGMVHFRVLSTALEFLVDQCMSLGRRDHTLDVDFQLTNNRF